VRKGKKVLRVLFREFVERLLRVSKRIFSADNVTESAGDKNYYVLVEIYL